jgi:transposase
MAPIPPVDHDCVLKDIVIDQANRITKLEHQLALLLKAHVGPKTERAKIPKKPRTKPTPDETAAKRKSNAAQKAALATTTTTLTVPPPQRSCPHCGNDNLKPVGKGTTTTVWEFVPATFIRHDYVQETLRCSCNGYIVKAPPPKKVIERGKYGASFLAHLVVAKCADHLPLYRLEKEFARIGVPVARSTMNELLHAAASKLRPIAAALIDRLKSRRVVMADETRMRMLDDGTGKPTNGFMWTFVADDEAGGRDVALVFAGDRSGETPRRILTGTDGFLLVDGYSGYNGVPDVSTRVRAGCHAHLRRYFVDAQSPDAQPAIDLVGELYSVEHEAARRSLHGKSKLEFRKLRSAPIRDRLKRWLDDNAPKHPPRSPIGKAFTYARNSWIVLGRFLDDPDIPLDNNASEAALRRVALGRKNYLFVGDVGSGDNIGVLYTLIATCEARGINPFAYLTDVLERIGSEPIDVLLPSAWSPRHDAAPQL